MTPTTRRPAITLVDDDYHSARLLMRTLEAHGAPSVRCLSDPQLALDALADDAGPNASSSLVVVDLKSTSTATAEFIARLKDRAPDLVVVAMAPTLDRETRNQLLAAQASAVFERHADIALYRREAAGIVDFWARARRLDETGT
jgi:CheY-like chemotaxis protein